MAETRTSSEGQASLSLKEKALPQHNTMSASTPEPPPILPMPTPKNDTETEAESEKAEYITGLKLHMVLFGLTLVGFVIMLDQTIVATVS
jgi:hypothetical protein